MIRVLLTGAEAVARALRDAGVEVVLLGADAAPAVVAAAAVQEDVDAVVAADPDRAELLTRLRQLEAVDIPVLTPRGPEDAVEVVRTSVRSDG